MSIRALPFALFVVACEPTDASSPVEVSLHGEPTTTARVTEADDGGSPLGALYLNVVAVKARYEEVIPESACDGMDHDDDEADEADDDGGEWWTLAEGFRAVDISSELSSHEDPIGVAELPPGAVTELRLVLDAEANATWITPNGEEIDVVVPSGASSGLKLKGCMPVREGYATVIDIEADLADALHETGSGTWKLHPTLKVTGSLKPEDGDDGE